MIPKKITENVIITLMVLVRVWPLSKKARFLNLAYGAVTE